MAEPIPDSPAVICPRCGTPVRPNTPFCDHCGARVSPPPACTICGTLLEPNSRFCPSCGTMVGPSPPSPAPNAGPAGKALPEGGMQSPSPGRSFWRRRAGITVPPGIKSLLHPRAVIARYGGAILLCAALLLILAGIFALAAPAFSLNPAEPVAVITPSATVPVTIAATPSPSTVPNTEANGSVSLVPGSVDQVPRHLQISLEIERDPRSSVVSVTFRGGKGQYGVREIFVRLTRSDGTVLTGTFKPAQTGSGIELQGTEKVDRVEVTARYYTGDEYKIADQIFEYKIRT